MEFRRLRAGFCAGMAMVLSVSVLAGCGGDTGKKEKTDESGLLEYPSYQASDYVTLGDYKKLTVYADLNTTEVTDEEVMSYMQSMVMPQEVDKAAELGDVVNIDFDGKVDGESFEGGTSTSYDLSLGSGSFIEGFEDQLVGVKKGDEKDVTVTFPEGYPASGELELAGKEAVFAVKVNSVKQTPELNDDAIPDMTGGEYKTIKEYKEVLRVQMEDSKQQQVDTQKDNLVVQKLLEDSKFEDGGCEDLNTWYIEMNVQAYEKQAKASEKETDDFINEYSGGQMKNEEELREALTEVAAENTKTELVVHAIAEKEDIKIDKKYYEEHLDDVAMSAGYNSGGDFEKDYSRSVIENTMLLDRVLEFVGKGLTVKPASEDPSLKESDSSEIDTDVKVESANPGEKKSDDAKKSDKDGDAKQSEDTDTKDEKDALEKE